jgi:chromodomain-helicase-DNA-binding protein 4
VDYATEKDAADAASITAEDAFEDDLTLLSPVKKATARRKKHNGSESDTDFQAESEDESEPEPEADVNESINSVELGAVPRPEPTPAALTNLQKAADAFDKYSSKSSPQPSLTVTVQGARMKAPVLPPHGGRTPTSKGAGGNASSSALPHTIDLTSTNQGANASPAVKPFRRAQMPTRSPLETSYGSYSNRTCPACRKQHPAGACELKAAGVEHCGLCGLAHFGHSRTCPHIKSETQVRAMLEALRNSNEPKELVDAAMKYLRGVKGTLVQQKKRDREKAAAVKNGALPGPAKSRALPPNSGGYVPYGPSSSLSEVVPQFPTGPPTQYPIGLPQRDMPSWYKESEGAGPSRPAGSKSWADKQKMLQMQAQGRVNEEEMESALRGFLGH